MSTLSDAEARNPAVVADIQRIAASLGVPADLALATAYQESGFNPQAVGDQGTSFGLYQLHRGGELGSLTPQQAFDPTTNATVALTQVRNTMLAHQGVTDPGTIAAMAQRPADQAGYARSVDALLGVNGGTPQQATLTGGINIPSPVVPGGIPVPGFIVNPLEHLGGNVASDFVKQIVSSGLVIRSTLVVTGLIILFIGLSQLSKGGNGPSTTVVEGATTTSKHIGRATKTATEAAVAE